RVVSASTGASDNAVAALAQKLHLETPRISESEATTLLRSYLGASGAKLPIADPQLVFLDGVIEFFGIMENEGRSTTVRLRARASFSEEALRLHIEEITIGALDIPSGIPNFIAATALKNQIAALELQLVRSSVRGLFVRDGFVEIAF
ncbi:MAG: hypothetical protein HY471_00020, partial [Candidatus Sungbacteria bacterium]|nr:hypothetical protein [Candidatus Sungbacteria bacterium]